MLTVTESFGHSVVRKMVLRPDGVEHSDFIRLAQRALGRHLTGVGEKWFFCRCGSKRLSRFHELFDLWVDGKINLPATKA